MVQVKDSLRVMLLAVGFAQNTSVITGWSWASHAQTLITMARPRMCLELLRWAMKAPLLGYHIQPSTSHLDSALS